MNEKYFGRGNEELYGDYIDFINYVFGFNGNAQNFINLLPKLYKPKYEPVKSSYITTEGGKIKAAVGAFDHKIKVCGRELICRGIGNVAVHPFARSGGYMRTLMNMALDDMVADGIDLSILGGRRQRYNYFSYEPSGALFSFTLNNDNMRHNFGTDRSERHSVSIKLLHGDDEAGFDNIAALLTTQKYNPCRERARLYDILRSWESLPYVVEKSGEFAGFFLVKGEKIHEIILCNPSDFIDTLVTFYDEKKLSKLTVNLPAFAPEYINAIYRVCEGYSVSPSMSFSVLNFRRVTDAFLSLKSEYESLPDGSLTLLIHGRAGDERIKISVSGGRTSVTEWKGECAAELEHIDAINMLFSPFCPGRERLPDFVRIWLPLPLWLFYADEV